MRSTAWALGVVDLLALGACKKWSDKMEAGRQALIDSATPCPAPATCSGSMTVTQRQVSTCSAPPAEGKTYAPGDVVIVKELADTPTLGRVKAVRGKSYEIEWAEGVTNERPADKVMAQVCR